MPTTDNPPDTPGSPHGSYGGGSYGGSYGSYGYASYGYGSYGSYGYAPRRPVREDLAKLLWFLEQYDEHLIQLEVHGGKESILKSTHKILNSPFEIQGSYGSTVVSLSKPDGIRSAFYHVGLSDVHFEVRRLHHGFPAYFLTRINRDYWGSYSLIVEDLYRSPEYALEDERFVKLMSAGRERYFLRLSPYREQAAEILQDGGPADDCDIDDLLYGLGRTIFQAAWHTDQRLAFITAQHFNLPELRHAIELVYLSQSCDFSALRRFWTPTLDRFFTAHYPNQGIRRILAALPAFNGSDMNALAQRGQTVYGRLAALLNEFLRTSAPGGDTRGRTVPLWKLVLANYKRLGLLQQKLTLHRPFQEARRQLEAGAQDCTQQLLEGVA